jgi:hypothetical protein
MQRPAVIGCTTHVNKGGFAARAFLPPAIQKRNYRPGAQRGRGDGDSAGTAGNTAKGLRKTGTRGLRRATHQDHHGCTTTAPPGRHNQRTETPEPDPALCAVCCERRHTSGSRFDRNEPPTAASMEALSLGVSNPPDLMLLPSIHPSAAHLRASRYRYCTENLRKDERATKDEQ